MFVICRNNDPLFSLCTPLRSHELNPYSTKLLTLKSTVQRERLKIIKEEQEEREPVNHWDSQLKLRETVADNLIEDTKNCELVRSTCPGWFGKGLRKNRRKKKK